MVIAILNAIGELDIELEKDTCIIGAVSLKGDLQSFDGIVPVITNAM
jgi:magnesium chelatase family protein